jgi:hypothetical protein
MNENTLNQFYHKLQEIKDKFQWTNAYGSIRGFRPEEYDNVSFCPITAIHEVETGRVVPIFMAGNTVTCPISIPLDYESRRLIMSAADNDVGAQNRHQANIMRKKMMEILGVED